MAQKKVQLSKKIINISRIMRTELKLFDYFLNKRRNNNNFEILNTVCDFIIPWITEIQLYF